MAFRQQRDADTTSLLREMACYFAEFTIAPGNHYLTLASSIAASALRVTIATTNYDTLIEQALSATGRPMTYSAPATGRALSVLKLHGSCNFLPDTGTNTFRGVTFSDNATNFEGPTRVVWSNEEVRSFCAREDSLAPAIALYAPGKKVLFCPTFVSKQQEYWRTEVKTAKVVYVIGMRVLPEDDHIWGTLAASKARLEYVGFEPEEFRSWADANRLRDASVLEKTFASALPLIRIQLRN